jgi:iron complex outermembrane receptor protein
VPIYAIYTPRNAVSGGLDYSAEMKGFDLTLHLDANYADGFYANYTDPGFDTATGKVTAVQPKGDSSFIVNGRIALSNIQVGDNGQAVTVALWARNLLDEQHAFYRSYSTLSGGTGIFNEPRTYGVEFSVQM